MFIHAKKLSKFIFIGIILCLTLILFLFFDYNEVLIQSAESKTNDQGPVFNKIKYLSGLKQDVWMMNQSHHGVYAKVNEWDRLAIVVDKYLGTALFLQLPAGDLVWNDRLKTEVKNFSVSCFLCHSNGPRAIRPNLNEYKVSYFDRMKIFLWNIRIKMYGKIKEHESHIKYDKVAQVPFRHRSKIDNETLNIPACVRCHNDNSFLSRGFLTRQNAIAIQFMVNNGYMPPMGFYLNEDDHKKIQNFILGL